MAEDKIPVLTEVYKPKPAPEAVVTDDLVAKVTAQVKPRLESEVTDFVLDEVRIEVKKAQSDVISTTQNFVDKTRADFKTELPKMYQDSVKLSQVDIDTLKKEALDEAAALVRQEMAGFQAKMVADHQAQINATLETIAKSAEDNVQAVAKRAEESTNEQIGIMHSRVGTLQQEAFAKLKADFAGEKETLQQTAANEMQAVIADQVKQGQSSVQATIDSTLSNAVPEDALIKLKADFDTEKEAMLNATSDEIRSTFLGQMKEGQKLVQATIENTLKKSIPEEAFAQLRADFSAEKDTLLAAATAEIKATFSEEMAEGQQSLQANIDATLQKALPDMESKLRSELTAELQQLLLKVKFVLPE